MLNDHGLLTRNSFIFPINIGVECVTAEHLVTAMTLRLSINVMALRKLSGFPLREDFDEAVKDASDTSWSIGGEATGTVKTMLWSDVAKDRQLLVKRFTTSKQVFAAFKDSFVGPAKSVGVN